MNFNLVQICFSSTINLISLPRDFKISTSTKKHKYLFALNILPLIRSSTLIIILARREVDRNAREKEESRRNVSFIVFIVLIKGFALFYLHTT